ncbi:MAG: hypothetical protein K2O89_07535 [Clostridia bacterium]|nr:hypothetical protein [Clostridia bacterium]
MTSYSILVTIHYPEGFKHRAKHPTLKIGFIVKAPDEETAKQDALKYAQMTQVRHPRKYKGCTFSVQPDDIELF